MITIEQYNEIQAYKEMGKTRVEVASLMGINRDTVGSWWNKQYKGSDHSPEWLARNAERVRKYRERVVKQSHPFSWQWAD